MAPILRVKLRWEGFPGAPGFNVFHFGGFEISGPTSPPTVEAQSAVDRVRAWAAAIADNIPAGIQLVTESEPEVIEDTNGELVTFAPTTAPAVVSGSVTSAVGYSSATGANVTWTTGGVVRGRRVRGRTFVVPLGYTSYGTDGTLDTATRTDLINASNVLADGAGSPRLGVYSRPSGVGLADGSWHPVTAVRVPDKAAVLRSRRD